MFLFFVHWQENWALKTENERNDDDEIILTTTHIIKQYTSEKNLGRENNVVDAADEIRVRKWDMCNL